MQIELVTKEDLQLFRQQLLGDLKLLMNTSEPKASEWLKSAEVRKFLKISAGTLQNLRIAGVLKPVKIGGLLYYRSRDIEDLLNKKA
ncbi:DNA-binding protein [Dyadobacter luteus]|uniref:DNA-binding protein n=1 Tax=Dyadobacter luteus TaxID=2259619 RepID=A0A3D8Y9B9_9BACT|nr:helix-turn-helix domain-containing protein [Dyadobacter luteus]REA60064.1 DNA-binding protein [Dyadobacter luteus]